MHTYQNPLGKCFRIFFFFRNELNNKILLCMLRHDVNEMCVNALTFADLGMFHFSSYVQKVNVCVCVCVSRCDFKPENRKRGM